MLRCRIFPTSGTSNIAPFVVTPACTTINTNTTHVPFDFFVFVKPHDPNPGCCAQLRFCQMVLSRAVHQFASLGFRQDFNRVKNLVHFALTWTLLPQAWLFLPNVIFSLILQCPLIAGGSLSCLISSLWYHWSHNRVARIADMVSVHTIFIYFSWQVAKVPFGEWPAELYFAYLVPMGYAICSYWLCGMSSIKNTGDYWHVTVHVSGNVAVAIYSHACSYMKGCGPCGT